MLANIEKFTNRKQLEELGIEFWYLNYFCYTEQSVLPSPMYYFWEILHIRG
jgi:hypothetical protein